MPVKGKTPTRIPTKYCVKNPKPRKRIDYSNFTPFKLNPAETLAAAMFIPEEEPEEDIPVSSFEATLDSVIANIWRLCNNPVATDEIKDQLDNIVHTLVEICDPLININKEP